MAKALLTIHVHPDREPARAPHNADAAPVAPNRDGARARAGRDDDDLWADYDPERFRAGLRQVAGMITPQEGEQLKQRIYRSREQGTRLPDRPRGRTPDDPDP